MKKLVQINATPLVNFNRGLGNESKVGRDSSVDEKGGRPTGRRNHLTLPMGSVTSVTNCTFACTGLRTGGKSHQTGPNFWGNQKVHPFLYASGPEDAL